MAAASLFATALLDLILFAAVSFDFNRLHFAGPLAYGGFLHRQPALMLHFLNLVAGLWFGARWVCNRGDEPPSPKPHATKS